MDIRSCDVICWFHMTTKNVITRFRQRLNDLRQKTEILLEVRWDVLLTNMCQIFIAYN